MRDYDSDDFDYGDDGSYTDSPASRGWDGVQTLALLGALALITAPAIKSMSRRWRVRHPVALGEPAIDDALAETFPASDPPASRYVDIPENRR